MKIEMPYIIRINPFILILGILLFIIIPFLIWANYFKIEQTARAKGTIITTSKIQQIQSINEGIIKEIFVKEGDVIKQGQIIAKIDEKQAQLEYEAIKSKLAATEATISRLEAEMLNKEISFTKNSEEYKEFINSETILFKRKKESFLDEINVLNNSLKLSKEELNLMTPLSKTGDIGTIELIKLKRQVSDIEGQIINKKNKYFQDAQTELVKYKQELAIIEQQLNDKKLNLERTEIISPMEGIVNNILITTKGATIKAGDIIIEVVPEDKLILEAKLNPLDISFIKEGQKAFIKLDAYDYSIFGGLEGKVYLIGSDILIDKTNGKEEKYFKVLISIDSGKEIKTKIGQKIKVSSGMGGDIDIITNERTVLTYLTKPIIKTLDNSFKER